MPNFQTEENTPLTAATIAQLQRDVAEVQARQIVGPLHEVLIRENREASRELESERMTRDLGFFQEAYGMNPYDLNFSSILKSSKKIRAFRETAYALAGRARQATIAETTFGQLLRAGLQQIANEWAQRVPTTYKTWIQEVTSDKYEEFYGPLHRTGIPREVLPGSNFPETQLAGLDIRIINRLFGAIIALPRQLFDDDQSNQIKQRAQDLGSGMPYMEEGLSYLKFIGAATTFPGTNDPVPASATKPSNESTWPWSTSLVGGGANRPTYYGRLNRANIIAGDVALQNQVDLLGNKMLVNADTILLTPVDSFDAKVLFQSEYMPSEVTGVAGTTGGAFSRNVLKGLYAVVVSKFLPAKAWALMEAGKGIVFQRRDPTEVMQENPMAGPAFTQDVYRFKTRARFEIDWVDPRHAWLGDDGSV